MRYSDSNKGDKNKRLCVMLYRMTKPNLCRVVRELLAEKATVTEACLSSPTQSIKQDLCEGRDHYRPEDVQRMKSRIL